LRYYDCERGSVYLDGIDILDYSVEDLHNEMAVVSQEPELIDASLENNLLYGLKRVVSPGELGAALHKSQLNEVAERLPLGLQTRLGDRGVKLSGGERQRVAICRTILKHANIIILDEATSSLDSQTEQNIQSALEVVMEKSTVIVIAHRLSTIKSADQIVVIGDGIVLETGNFSSLINKVDGHFRALWKAQSSKSDVSGN